MELKSSKPLIIITAALSLAVITLSIQVVFLTFTVKDQKDSLRYITSSMDVHTIQNKLNGMQNNLLDITRAIDGIKADNNRLSAEVATMSSIVNQASTDSRFLQRELESYNQRLTQLEQKANDVTYELESLKSAINP